MPRVWGVLGFFVLATACHDESLSDAGNAAAKDAQVAVSGPYDTCSVDADCAWGEVDHEILRAKDCPCLYGCPHLPLAKSTVLRRAQAYEALCDPRRAGDGELCGIDDCAMPPRIACVDGKCRAGADAGAL